MYELVQFYLYFFQFISIRYRVRQERGVKILEKKVQKHLEYMFYSSTFAPAIERDSGDEMLRKNEKNFLKKTLKNIWS